MVKNNKDGLNQQLVNAAKDGDLDQVKELIKAGADVNCADEEKNSPLHLTSRNKSLNEISFFLLEQGAKPDARDRDGDTPFHSAAYHDNYELLEKLFVNLKEKETSLNFVNNFKWIPLHSFASNFNGDWELIEWFLENGSDPEALTITGDSVSDLLGNIEESYRERYIAMIEKK